MRSGLSNSSRGQSYQQVFNRTVRGLFFGINDPHSISPHDGVRLTSARPTQFVKGEGLPSQHEDLLFFVPQDVVMHRSSFRTLVTWSRHQHSYAFLQT